LRATRAFGLAAALVALGFTVTGCGGSHSAAQTKPTDRQTVNTVPEQASQLVAKNFPSALTGFLTLDVDSAQGHQDTPGASKRKYTVTLDNLVLRLAGTQGTGNHRRARYRLVSADESIKGFENITSSRCQTTHIVWAGPGRKPTGTVDVLGPSFDAGVGFLFLVRQRGQALTRPCKATSGGRKSTLTSTAKIQGDANLRLEAAKDPTQRFSIGVEIRSSTVGPSASGGYTVSGLLAPTSESAPVTLCRNQGGNLDCSP
jgi:hypothetical protein